MHICMCACGGMGKYVSIGVCGLVCGVCKEECFTKKKKSIL